MPVEQRIESIEVQYMEDHYAELAAYLGEWLLIDGTELVIHSGDFADIQSAVHDRNISSPFVHYVVPGGEMPFIAI